MARKGCGGVATPLSQRTPLDEEQVRALVGALFFGLALYYVTTTLTVQLRCAASSTSSAAWSLRPSSRQAWWYRDAVGRSSPEAKRWSRRQPPRWPECAARSSLAPVVRTHEGPGRRRRSRSRVGPAPPQAQPRPTPRPAPGAAFPWNLGRTRSPRRWAARGAACSGRRKDASRGRGGRQPGADRLQRRTFTDRWRRLERGQMSFDATGDP